MKNVELLRRSMFRVLEIIFVAILAQLVRAAVS